MRRPLLVGIDAGGTATRARAVQDGTVVFESRGGPANPNAADLATVRDSLIAALDGCPEPERIVASAAGTHSAPGRDLLSAALHDLYPTAVVEVIPDYVAAFAASPAGTDVCVIAGTGSVVCSPGTNGSWHISGGYGWLLGDHGSAAQLGKALLAHYVDDPAPPAEVRAAICELFGTDDRRAIVRALQTSPAPARALAAAAPVLTRFAEAGHDFALTSLRAGMDRLAFTTARHIGEPQARAMVSLAGGVWTSTLAVATFVEALGRRSPAAVVNVDALPIHPLDGALALAAQP